MPHHHGMHPGSKSGELVPRLIAWEITRSCNLACQHCRASSLHGPYDNELTTEECFAFIDDVASFAKPTLIITGGEPLVRPDWPEIVAYAGEKGLPVVMSPNGTNLTPEVANQMVDLNVRRISVSIDFPSAELHDKFRGVPGAFEGALQGIRNAKAAGLEFQINTTVTKLNVDYLDEMLDLTIKLDAAAYHIFLLVPTGRGKELEKEELPPQEYERVLNWAYDRQKSTGMFFKPTDAPHYYRIVLQRKKEEGGEALQTSQRGQYQHVTRGCGGGVSFCFVSHRGQVQMCGYLDVAAGNIKEQPFSQIWRESQFFHEIRDFSQLKGKCGICEYKQICGGCRARAYAVSGDYMAEEKYCVHEPLRTKREKESEIIKA